MTAAIGSPVYRVDGFEKVKGHATYAAEFHPHGLAYAAIVESTISSGRIVEMDITAARQAKGVLLVMTHENAPRLAYGPFKENRSPAINFRFCKVPRSSFRVSPSELWLRARRRKLSTPHRSFGSNMRPTQVCSLALI